MICFRFLTEDLVGDIEDESAKVEIIEQGFQIEKIKDGMDKGKCYII